METIKNISTNVIGWTFLVLVICAMLRMFREIARCSNDCFSGKNNFDDDEEESPKPPKKPAIRMPAKSQNTDSTLFDADDSHAVHLSEAPEDPLADTPAEPKKEGETPWDIYVRQQQKQKPL